MTESNKRRFVSCVEEDRISNLPEHLIFTILELLPLQDAVKSSILSKRWRYRWTKMGALAFNEFFNKFAKNRAFGRNGFIRIINKVLNLHTGPILRFFIHIPNINMFHNDDSFEEVDQWMLLLSRNGVRELIFSNSNKCYKLPCYLFSCLELTKLTVQNCVFKPPLEFKGFINLTDLHLKYIDFICGTQINLPQLATKLHNLFVSNCPDVKLLRLLHSPCLTVLGTYFPYRVEGITLEVMLSNLPKIEYLSCDDFFFKVSKHLAFTSQVFIEKKTPNMVNSLKHLQVLYLHLGDLDQLHGILCLLRNSPNLESLYVICFKTDPRVDVGPALSYLEAPDCLDCTLSKLKSVTMISLEGSVSN
ncbi:hypothetical protein LXL04_033151 [Taraxacum kok-saghyz]